MSSLDLLCTDLIVERNSSFQSRDGQIKRRDSHLTARAQSSDETWRQRNWTRRVLLNEKLLCVVESDLVTVEKNIDTNTVNEKWSLAPKYYLLKALQKNYTRSLFEKKFESQLNKFAKYLNPETVVSLTTAFDNVIERVISFGFKEAKISITSNPSISFRLNNKDSYSLIMDVFVEVDSDYKIVYSLFENKQLIDMRSGSLDDVSKSILEVLDSSTGSKTRNYSDVTKDTRLFSFEF